MPTAPRRTGGLLRNLQVSQKLFAGFGVLCLLVVAVGLAGLLELSQAGRRLDHMYEQNLLSTARLGDIRADVHESTSLTSKLILRSALTDVSSVQTAIQQLDTDIDKAWAAYTSLPGAVADRDAFTATLAEYRKARDEQLVPAAATTGRGKVSWANEVVIEASAR